MFLNRLLEILGLSKHHVNRSDHCKYNFTLNKDKNIIYYFRQIKGDNFITYEHYIKTSSPLVIKYLSFKEIKNLLSLNGCIDYDIENKKGSQLTLNNVSIYPSPVGVTIEFYNYITNKSDLMEICNDIYNIYNS